ncbi:hypothetical protein DAI22_06g066000 [Oryza sativa Japonica Group]|nr:hypothetical protein DAI22_06g066000 [Oryza sativa Japonica Group]
MSRRWQWRSPDDDVDPTSMAASTTRLSKRCAGRSNPIHRNSRDGAAASPALPPGFTACVPLRNHRRTPVQWLIHKNSGAELLISNP